MQQPQVITGIFYHYYPYHFHVITKVFDCNINNVVNLITKISKSSHLEKKLFTFL